jgi:hypothetical protein
MTARDRQTDFAEAARLTDAGAEYLRRPFRDAKDKLDSAVK